MKLILILSLGAIVPSAAMAATRSAPEALKGEFELGASITAIRRNSISIPSVQNAGVTRGEGLLRFDNTQGIPNWKYSKARTEAAFDRMLETFNDSRYPFDRDLKSAIEKIRELVYVVEANDRKETQRRIAFFRNHPVNGVSFERLKARLELLFDLHMGVTYGWFMPQSFNEGLAEAAQKIDIPGYPLSTNITLVEYCERYQPYQVDINRIIDRIDAGFIDKSKKGLCSSPD